MEDWRDEWVAEPGDHYGESGERVPLSVRTKDFALQVVRLYCSLPPTTEAQVLGKQLLRSGTSLGAHYREASRARSDAEFISKLEGGLQELEESKYWMELLRDAGIIPGENLGPLHAEAEHLTGILIAVVCKAKARRDKRKQTT